MATRADVPFASVNMQAVDYGIAVIEQDALAASALPDLNFADDSPIRGWVFRKRIMVLDHTAPGSSGGLVPIVTHLDLKSRRKIDDSELVLIINNNNVDGAPGPVKTEGLIRCLFLLP